MFFPSTMVLAWRIVCVLKIPKTPGQNLALVGFGDVMVNVFFALLYTASVYNICTLEPCPSSVCPYAPIIFPVRTCFLQYSTCPFKPNNSIVTKNALVFNVNPTALPMLYTQGQWTPVFDRSDQDSSSIELFWILRHSTKHCDKGATFQNSWHIFSCETII